MSYPVETRRLAVDLVMKRGFSKRAAAHRVGVDEGSVRNWTKGFVVPPRPSAGSRTPFRPQTPEARRMLQQVLRDRALGARR